MTTTAATATTESTDPRRSDRLRALALLLSAALAATALVLGTLVWRAVDGGPTVTAEVGDQLPLRSPTYGRSVTVVVPGSEVTVRVGAPVETLGHELMEVEYDDPAWDEQQDLAAPEDGSLIPVSWGVRALGLFAEERDSNPIEVRLVVGDQRLDLASIVLGDSISGRVHGPTSVAVGIDGRPSVEDIAVEVEYDGLTQTADVETGEIDAGVAEALYDANRNFSSGCAEVVDSCAFVVADPDSPLRPAGADFTASNLTLYPYDAALGWADEGTLWAGVRLQLFSVGSVQNAAGDTWSASRRTAPVVTLDGAQPVRREGLDASSDDVVGRVVFAVDTDAEPRELLLKQVVSFTGAAGAPQDLPIRSRLRLVEIG